MSEQNTAFEKWADDYGLYCEPSIEIYDVRAAYTYATAEANKRIAELQADNERLREALETCEEEKVYNGFSYEIQKTFNSEKVKKALSATPAESLQEVVKSLDPKMVKAFII